MEPVKEMLHFHSLPLNVSQSPQYMRPPSRFPLRSLYKEKDAPFQKPSLTCLKQFSEFPVKKPSLQGSLRAPIDRDITFTACSLTVNEPPYRFPSGAPIHRESHFQSLQWMGCGIE
jgi:hypothetical protein